MTGIAERARLAARDAHAGQTDKQGRDYLLHHLQPVADELLESGEEAVAAGWLHDIVEDTHWSIEDVRRELGDRIADAVDACTRRDGESYDDLVGRAAADPLGRLVKLADNTVNLAGNELLALTDPATADRLLRKYTRARERLLGSIDR